MRTVYSSALLFALTVLSPCFADSPTSGRLLGSGDGYEIREPVPLSQSSLLANPAPSATVVTSQVQSAPPGSLILSSGTLTMTPAFISPPAPQAKAISPGIPTSVTPLPNPLPTPASISSINAPSPLVITSQALLAAPPTPALTLTPALQPGSTFGTPTLPTQNQTIIYTNTKSQQSTQFRLPAGVILSAVSDGQFVFVLERQNTNLGMITISCATTSMFTPVTQLMLYALPLDQSQPTRSIEVDTKINPTSGATPTLNITLQENVITVPGMDRYKFDGKEFRIVY